MADGPSTQPDTLPPIDLERIEEAETPEAVHAVTRELLGQASGILAQSRINPDIQRQFISEYNGATEEYISGYTSQQAEFIGRIAALRDEVPQTDGEIHEAEETQERVSGMQEMMRILFENNSGNRQDFAGNLMMLGMQEEFQNINFVRYFFEEPYSSEIIGFVISNPSYLQSYVENDLSFVMGCAGGEVGDKMIAIQSAIREAYLESKENIVQENIQTYLLNAGISEIQIDEVEEDGSFNELIQSLRAGDCNVENIARIRDFNETHFPEHNLTLTEEDARNILGSTIELRRTENELALANLRDELSQITGKTFEEIQILLNSNNPETIGVFLDDYRNDSRVGEIEGELFELLDIRSDIAAQTSRLDEVVVNAGTIYQMSPQEREEYRSYLVNKYKNLQNTLEELISESDNPQERENLRAALEVYFGDSYTFEQIIEKPETRLTKITNKLFLKEFLTDYNRDPRLIAVHFKALPISLRNDKEIAMAFPGKISANDLPFMYASLLSDSHFVKSIISRSINRREENVGMNISDIPLLLQRYCASGGDTQEMVRILADIFESHPEIKNQISDSIPFSIINSDNEDILGLNFRASSMTEDSILNYLSSLGEIDGPQDATNRVTNFREIDRYLQQNNNEEIKLLLIEKRGLYHTSYLKSNLGRSSIIWEAILEYDIGGIQFLEESTRRDEYFQESFVNRLTKEEAFGRGKTENNLGYLIGYIPLEGPEEIYHFFSLLKEKFPDELNNEGIYTYIGNNEGFRNTISAYFEVHGVEGLSEEASEFVRQCIMHSAGFMSQVEEGIETHISKIESARLESVDYRGYFSNILQNSFPELSVEDLEIVLDILERANGTPLEEGSAEIIRIFGERTGEFLTLVITENITYADNEQRRIAGLPRIRNEYDERFHRYIDNEGALRLDLIRGVEGDIEDKGLYGLIYAQYLRNHPEGGNEESFRNFSNTYLIHNFGLNLLQAQEICEIFITQYKGNLNRRTLRDMESYTRSFISGDATSFMNGLRDSYNRDIENTYSGAYLGEHGEVVIPPKIHQLTPENISSPDLRDTYREISYELNLSEVESQSLTLEELNLIAGDEKVRESFISFRQTLIELNMESIWQFRNQIFRSIGSLDFNLNDGDYIGENELNIFLSRVVYATTSDERLRETPSNLDTTKQIIRQINRVGGFSGQEDISLVGEGGSILETSFRQQFAPKDASIIGFRTGAFLEALHS